MLAAGAWIGGLAVLVAALPAATRALEPGERTRALSAVVGRFSGLALISVALLLIGGIAQSLLELGAVNDLWDTPFGRAIAIKAALVVVLLGLGALNRRRTLPRLQRAADEGASPGAARRAAAAHAARRGRARRRRPGRDRRARGLPARHRRQRRARSPAPPTSGPPAPS